GVARVFHDGGDALDVAFEHPVQIRLECDARSLAGKDAAIVDLGQKRDDLHRAEVRYGCDTRSGKDVVARLKRTIVHPRAPDDDDASARRVELETPQALF